MEASAQDALSCEEVLLNEFRKSRTRAFERIFSLFYPAIAYYASELLRDREGGREVASDVFVKLWERRKEFDSMNIVKGFLYVSARNACRNKLRGDKVAEDRLRVSFPEKVPAEVPEEEDMTRVFETEVLAEMHKAIEELPEQTRKVMLLTIEGFSTREIALRLHLNAQTVRNTRVRGIGHLKKSLKKVDAALVETV